MSFGRLVVWCISIIMGLIPINWIRLWYINQIPQGENLSSFLIGASILWGISGAIIFFLIKSAKGLKLIEEEKARELKELLALPVVEVTPTQALLKPDEKAYAKMQAELIESKTVGYSANSKSVSVRVAKGVTLRTGGTRGKAIKGMVTVALGELVVTNERIVFSGDKKSFAINLKNLLNYTAYSDGFGFSDSKKTYTVTSENDNERQRFLLVLNKILQQQ